jgi:hypothetical protein
VNLIPLRTAVIAGTCAVALSFVALPAHAGTITSSGAGSSAAATPFEVSPTDEPTTEPTDDGSTPTDGATTPTDDSGAEDTTGDDSGSDVADDQGDESGSDDAPAPVETPVVLPAEKGTPKQTFQQTVFLPKTIATRGIHVVYSGLTPKAKYQPYYNGGQFGGELGHVKKANAKGVVNFVYHFSKADKWMTKLGASYGVGLLGLQTDLRLERQVEVKYDSDVALATERHGKKVALAVSVEKAGVSGKNSAWKKVSVEFQKKTGTKWVTVKTVKTNSKGVAKATVKARKSMWRAVVDSGTNVAGTTTKGHRK